MRVEVVITVVFVMVILTRDVGQRTGGLRFLVGHVRLGTAGIVALARRSRSTSGKTGERGHNGY